MYIYKTPVQLESNYDLKVANIDMIKKGLLCVNVFIQSKIEYNH